MRFTTVILVAAMLALSACNDDPIIGPTDEDTNGGSYGVIHFNTTPEEPGEEPSALDAKKKENPKRF